MSSPDKAQYGRVCLLVLNICPITLRQVINDYCTRTGSLSIQNFLEKNKHDLFHLLWKRCCCRRQQSRTTPMKSSQWDSLFIKNTSSCQRGKRDACPCQYNAKPGISTSVLDITLSCLLIKNICPGITAKIAHIDTIREVRNKLIHAGSTTLDMLTYRRYWNRVEYAIIDIAGCVSSKLHSDTKKMVADLQTQVMNTGEIAKDLRELIVHEKRIDDLEKNVSNITDDLGRLTDNTKETTQELKDDMHQLKQDVEELKGNMSRIETAQGAEYFKHKQEIKDETHQQKQEFKDTCSLHQHGQKAKDYMHQLKQDVEEIKGNMSRIEIAQEDQSREMAEMQQQQLGHSQKLSDMQQNIKRLRQRLIKINTDTTKAVPISPLQERGEDEMPIERLYASVVVCVDPKYLEKGCDSPRHTREVTEPSDIFIKDGKITKTIYLIGDAAHGKTSYCIWLIKKWCDAQKTDIMGSKRLNKWENFLERFDFVFLLMFRNVNSSRASVIDMICQDVFREEKGSHATIRHVLSSDSYKSLIIMDGLDEWTPNKDSIKQLTIEGMPNIENISSSVSCFISMRPWVFSKILKAVKVSDSVIEIYGLNETGMKKVIENVLSYHFKLKDDQSKYDATYDKIVRFVQGNNLKSFMQIPLLAVVCVQIWYKEEQVGKNMTSFYAVMLNMLIERASQTHDLRRVQAEHDKSVDIILPEILSENECIEKFISVLLKLGQVAYDGLLSKEENLVFQKRKLEKQIGVRELQCALNVGLISQNEESSITTKKVSVHFFHKSIQEFIAAIHVVTKKEVMDLFCQYLTNVNVIMELSNVILFICGMCPSLGSVISKRVVCLTDSDSNICKYRESLLPPSKIGSVTELYKLQISWYREVQPGKTDNQVIQKDSLVTQTDRPVTFHVSDVYLDMYCDVETVRVIREILSNQHVSIRSLRLDRVPTDIEKGITNIDLNDFLSNTNNTSSLVMLYINGRNADRSVHTLCGPSLKYLGLREVAIDTHFSDNVCPPLLAGITQLRVLELWSATLGDRGLGLSPDMVNIETVKLLNVNMSAAGWGDFVLSASSIQHSFNVEQYNTNIDSDSVTMIRSSPNFKITKDHVDGSGRHTFNFKRV